MTWAIVEAAPNRWLEVRQARGNVTLRASSPTAAKVGDRLTQVGQGISTGGRSSTILAADDGIGFIRVSEDTDLRLTRLTTLSNGGKVTEVTVTRGQARLNVRRFNNPSSRLEIKTPAGVAAVRGTEFGVTVNSVNSQMGIATRSGSVAAIAQGRNVAVRPNQYSLIIPGEPPTPPRPLPQAPQLSVQRLTRSGNQIQLQATTEPPNLVFVNDQPIALDRNGQLNSSITASGQSEIEILVRNPFGEERAYRVQAP
ncbi:MAG: FecR domain-containing protein [Cyanobacteria bacterium P01_H01_bin.121]